MSNHTYWFVVYEWDHIPGGQHKPDAFCPHCGATMAKVEVEVDTRHHPLDYYGGAGQTNDDMHMGNGGYVQELGTVTGGGVFLGIELGRWDLSDFGQAIDVHHKAPGIHKVTELVHWLRAHDINEAPQTHLLLVV